MQDIYKFKNTKILNHLIRFHLHENKEIIQTIARDNNIKDINKISPGQQLKLPNGTIYTVAAGDTLGQIANNQFRGADPVLPTSTSTTAGAGRGLINPTLAKSTVQQTTTAPAATAAPANVVKSGSGAPIRTGSGGYITSGPVPNNDQIVKAKAKLTPSQIKWLGNADPTDPAIMARMPKPLPGEKIPSNTATQIKNISGDQDIMNMIIKHEGIRDKPYKDSLGLWTVGVGHLIGDGKTLPQEWNRKFTKDEIMALFQKDYQHHKTAAQAIPGFNKLNPNGQAALIDLTFNMGPVWWKKWPNFTRALSAGDLENAAKNLETSKWYTQVGNRAPAIVNLLRQGQLA